MPTAHVAMPADEGAHLEPLAVELVRQAAREVLALRLHLVELPLHHDPLQLCLLALLLQLLGQVVDGLILLQLRNL